MPAQFQIREISSGLWWNNTDGYGCKETADTFTAEERRTLNLPAFGEWILVAEGAK